MTRKELNLAIFEGKANQVLWQPRLEEWIFRHQQGATLPDRFKGLSTLDIYDNLRCSVRYAAIGEIETFEEPADLERREERGDGYLRQTIRTPSGEITTVFQEIWERGELLNSRIADFPVKTLADLRVAVDVIERTQYRANREVYQQVTDRVGPRGARNIFLTGSGFSELVENWAGVDAYYLLQDHPKEVEAYLEACCCRAEREVDAALELPCPIFSIGDRITDQFTPPPILKRYVLPSWQRLIPRLHTANRFVHSHWDGNCRAILPYLAETDLDAVEALTPAPQGDVTLEEIKQAVGNKMVVLDLIPALHFLPQYSTQELLDFTQRAIDLFAPHLILGVSDEISPAGQIEKIEAVSGLVDRICGLAD